MFSPARFRPFLVLALLLAPALAYAQPEGAEVETVETVQEGAAFIVPVEGMIDKALARYIDRATADATEANAAVIVYHIDTFGGLVDAADQIRKTILNAEPLTVAFIDKNAASAGALISYSADRIYMAPGSSIGAATVVEGGSGAVASEKYQSYMKGLMRATAEANGRDPQIAEAMVDDSLEVEGISRMGELLTLSSEEAKFHGVADDVLENIDAVLTAVGTPEAKQVAHAASPAERILRFLGSPAISSILMLMMMGGLYFELQSPGVGFAGLMAVIGASLFFAPHYMMGLVESWEIVLFGLGVLLLIIEIFVIPGFGIPGILGVLFMVGSLGAALVGNVGLDFPTGSAISSAVATLAVTMVLLVILMFSLARYLPGNRAFNRLVLQPQLAAAEGYVAAESQLDLMGAIGQAITPLRPAGTALIGSATEGQRIDVVTSGEYIEAGAAIRVTNVQGMRIEVREVAALPKEGETSAA